MLRECTETYSDNTAISTAPEVPLPGKWFRSNLRPPQNGTSFAEVKPDSAQTLGK